MNTLLTVFKQAGWQLLGKGVSSLSTIIILGLITRNFGASETGVLTLALTYLSFFALISDFGLNVHVLPEFLKENLTSQWQKLLGMRLLLTVFSTLLATIIVLLWPGQTDLFKMTVLLGLFGIIEPGIYVTATAVFQSRLRYDLVVLANVGGVAVILLSVVGLILQKIGVPWVMLGYVAGWFVSGALALILIKKYVDSLLPIFDFSYIRKIFRESWPISLTLVLNIVYFRLDTFMISIFRNFAEVGVYNVAYQIFQTLLVVPSFIMNGYYPVMLKNFAENRLKFISQIKNATLAMFVLSILGVVFTYIFSPFVVDLITGGKGFAGSITSLRILSLAFPAFFVTSILMWTLITLRRYRLILAIYVTGLVTNGLLNLWLIPIFSYIASSWITVISEYLILVLQLIILRKVLH